jgi:hypothetical protein
MNKLSEIEVYLLEHWEDVANLKEAVKNFEEKITDSIEEIVSSLKGREWSKGMEISLYPSVGIPRSIDIFKKTWKFGRGNYDFVSIGVSPIELNGLMYTGEDTIGA